MSLETYNPGEVSIIISGIIVAGFGDGSFCSIDQNEDAFSLTIGTDGDGCRARSNNNSGRVTVTLLQSSASNDLLAVWHETDKLTGLGIGPLLVKDNSGRSIFAAEKCWIVRHPATDFDRTVTSKEWIIETDNLVQFPGGN